MKTTRLLSFSTLLVLVFVAPLSAANGFWGADDLRQIVRDYMAEKG